MRDVKKNVIKSIASTMLLLVLGYLAANFFSINVIKIDNISQTPLEGVEVWLPDRLLWRGNLKPSDKKMLFVQIRGEGSIRIYYTKDGRRYYADTGYVTPGGTLVHKAQIDAEFFLWAKEVDSKRSPDRIL